MSNVDQSRRRFIQLAAATAALFAARCAPPTGVCSGTAGTATGTGGAGGSGGAGGGDAGTGAAGLPTLGGAPDTPQGWVIAAFVDTIVPGRHRDPTGAPGGIDVGAPALFFDPELPALQFVGLLVLLLNSQTSAMFAAVTFDQLKPEERDQVVVEALKSVDLLDFAIQLAMLAFLSTKEAGQHLGYPGSNIGYWSDKDYSFKAAVSTEITADGNPP